MWRRSPSWRARVVSVRAVLVVTTIRPSGKVGRACLVVDVV
jgi:hypothetical protein